MRSVLNLARENRDWAIRIRSFKGREPSEIDPNGRTYAQIDGNCACVDSYGRLPFGCRCGRASNVPVNVPEDDDDDDDDTDTETVIYTRDSPRSRASSISSIDSTRTSTPPRGASDVRPQLHQMGRGISMAKVSVYKGNTGEPRA